MWSRVSACALFVLGLILILSFVGCGSVGSHSAASPTPTPPGATPSPTPAPAAHGTFVYVNDSGSGGTRTNGYRLNADGTLTALAGSPFPVTGEMASAGNFLVFASGNSVSSYQIDAAGGGLTKVGSGTLSQAIAVAADASNVYIAGNLTPAGSGTGIYGFALAGNGALTALAGSPFFFAGGCFFCDVPLALQLNNSFLIQGGVGFHGVGDFTVYPRTAGGVLGKAQILGADAEDRVAIQHPTGNFAYALDLSDGSLTEFTISAGGKPTGGTPIFTSGGDIAVDSTGRFLLEADITGVVNVFSIDPASGAFSQVGTSEAAGNGAFGISMDPSGRFVIVSQSSSTTNLPGAMNQITVFTFDPATGGIKKMNSYPQSPGHVVIASL
jgi:Lactonase, 7-bladed beta-propeller